MNAKAKQRVPIRERCFEMEHGEPAPAVLMLRMFPRTTDRRSLEKHCVNPAVLDGISKTDVPGADGAAIAWLRLLLTAADGPATFGGWNLLAGDTAIAKRSARVFYDQLAGKGIVWCGWRRLHKTPPRFDRLLLPSGQLRYLQQIHRSPPVDPSCPCRLASSPYRQANMVTKVCDCG